ncbi:hypothetical protein J3A83DRAFT_4374920 [Scleroderma citrinum]
MSSSPTCLTHSDTMIWDNPGQMSEDSSFHTAGSHISPMQSVHTQFMDESGATKSTSNAPSATSEGTASFSHTPLTHQNVVTWDNNSSQMNEDPSLLMAVDCSSMHSIYDGHPAVPLGIERNHSLDGTPNSSSSNPAPPTQFNWSESTASRPLCTPTDIQYVPSSLSSVLSVQCLPLSPCVPPGLKKSIQNLNTSLSNQIELELSEAFESTLNLIEQSFIKTYQQSLCDVMSTAVKSGLYAKWTSQPTKLMPGAWEQSISQL